MSACEREPRGHGAASREVLHLADDCEPALARHGMGCRVLHLGEGGGMDKARCSTSLLAAPWPRGFLSQALSFALSLSTRMRTPTLNAAARPRCRATAWAAACSTLEGVKGVQSTRECWFGMLID